MKTILEGKFNSALCHTVNTEDALETYTRVQILALCQNEIYKDAKIVMMPDAHPGKVGPIGLTMKIDKDTPIMPALIGNDIGCGMTTVKFIPKHKLTASDFKKLDTVLKSNKNNILDSVIMNTINENDWGINKRLTEKNIGTLGGGNHFIEIDIDENGEYYLTIHSGSRSVGGDVYVKFMDLGRKALLKDGIDIPYEDTYLYGELKDNYLRAVELCNNYASINRATMINNIMSQMKWKDNFDFEIISCKHNYIDIKDDYNVIHKGSISANKGERLVIPINMRDGIILGYGKGNIEWNCSAPHGSGRIIKRSDVKNSVTLKMFKESMEGIYSPSISSNTLDESPFAYRNIGLIKEAISDSVKITNIIKPVYNYKNGGKEI